MESECTSATRRIPAQRHNKPAKQSLPPRRTRFARGWLLSQGSSPGVVRDSRRLWCSSSGLLALKRQETLRAVTQTRFDRLSREPLAPSCTRNGCQVTDVLAPPVPLIDSMVESIVSNLTGRPDLVSIALFQHHHSLRQYLFHPCLRQVDHLQEIHAAADELS